MVCLEKIQAGASAFLDAEIMPKLPGLQRWLFGSTAALFLERLPDMVRNIPESNLFRTMGVISPDNEIDVETAYRLLKSQAKTGNASVTVPGIGVLTVTEADVDKLYNYIIR